MSVAVKKVPGVESVKVSLNKGLVTIQLKPGNSANLEQIRKAVTNQGFKPKKARVTAIGDLAESAVRWQFKVSGTSDVLPVLETAHAPWQKQAGKNVIVNGLVQAPATPNEPGSLQITQVSTQGQKGGVQ